MEKTNSLYQNDMTRTLKKADTALTRLSQREITDKILISLAITAFLSVVLYILKERLWG